MLPEFPRFDPAAVGADAVPAIEDGVYRFPTISTVEDDDTRDRLDRLYLAARDRGWRAALDEAYGGSGNVDYVTSEDRVAFLSQLPLGADQALLEIGVSLGQIAIPLAQRVRSVDGLEVVHGQALFAAERARQESVTNLRMASGGSDCRLPYADAGFDGVVLNLVLEWCADRESGSHEVAQQRLLDEIARVLKPGGFLFLQTKNRYALRLLIGGHDEHMRGRRFGNALPRWAERLLPGPRPRGRLHSYGALKAMLVRAGFGAVDGYWAVPEMRKPSKLVALDPAAIRAFRSNGGIPQGASRKERVLMALMPARLVRFFTPGLSFLARR